MGRVHSGLPWDTHPHSLLIVVYSSTSCLATEQAARRAHPDALGLDGLEAGCLGVFTDGEVLLGSQPGNPWAGACQTNGLA